MRAIKGNNIPGGAVTIVTTTTATITTIDTIPIITGKVFKINADVVAKKTDLTEKGGFLKQAIFANNSGTVSQQGITSSLFHNAQAGWNVTIVISGTNVLIRVKGAAGANINWKCSRTAVSV